jgi:CheY-like chemotaxis protein
LLGALVYYGKRTGSSVVHGQAMSMALGVFMFGLFMPNVDGFTVLDSLKVDEIQGPPVVLVVTGADRKTIQRLDAKQIHGVIRKPFDVDELVNLVVACSEIKSRKPYGAMALATMLGGAHMLSHWLK